jgi:hypothetical protein
MTTCANVSLKNVGSKFLTILYISRDVHMYDISFTMSLLGTLWGLSGPPVVAFGEDCPVQPENFKAKTAKWW